MRAFDSSKVVYCEDRESKSYIAHQSTQMEPNALQWSESGVASSLRRFVMCAVSVEIFFSRMEILRGIYQSKTPV